jgi:hypothetical protein
MDTTPAPLIRRINLYDLLPDAFNDRYHDAGGFLACVACGKKTSKNGNSLGVFINGGGGYITHPEDDRAEYAAFPEGYMGWFPIGRECIKAVPVEYRAPNPYDDKAAGVYDV